MHARIRTHDPLGLFGPPIGEKGLAITIGNHAATGFKLRVDACNAVRVEDPGAHLLLGTDYVCGNWMHYAEEI